MMKPYIEQQIQCHGTPLYLYDKADIVLSAGKVMDAFEGFHCLYSVKANPFEPILQVMRQLNIGIDAASGNEVQSALRLGFPEQDVYYSAPGKCKRDLEATVGTVQVIADSLRELGLINGIAEERGITAEAGVRLNIPNPAIQNSPFEVMGGAASKFGVEIDEFLQAVPSLKMYTHLKITGIHIYFGSQLLDERMIADNFAAISRAALQVSGHFPLQYINYGGGFGVPYESHEQGRPDLMKTADWVTKDEATHEIAVRGIRRNIELGRYLTAPCGLYITKVADIKKSGGITFAILNGGMNAFFRPLFTHQTHKVTVLGKTSDTFDMETVRLVGNTCTPLDVFYKEIQLPKLAPGDTVIFENAGAYGYSMSLLDFISFDRPKQMMI